MYYNFCGVHQTLRVTPAMESGISNHVRTIEELCGLLAEAASATKRIERELIRKALGMIDKYESRRIRGEIRRVLMAGAARVGFCGRADHIGVYWGVKSAFPNLLRITRRGRPSV